MIALVNALVECNIRVITIKQNRDITRQDMNSKIIIALFSLFAELERDLVSLRTIEALAAKKAQGQPLGKPKGTLQKRKFDKDDAKATAARQNGKLGGRPRKSKGPVAA